MDNMKKGTPLTPEEKTSFKDQVMGAVEAVFTDEGKEMSKEEMIETLCKGIEALGGNMEKDPMGGLGAEADEGMKLPEEETEE